VPSNSLNDLQITFDGYNHSSNALTYEIELDPSNYISHNKKSLLEPREKWFVNNSNFHIPNEVIGLLQLGEGFCLPPNDIPKLTIEYIKYVENNFSNFHQHNCINTCRSQICLFINQVKNIDRYRTETNFKILSALTTTKKFIKNNPDNFY